MTQLIKLNETKSDEMALIHTQSFPNFFLTSLGYHFLSVFYKSIIKDNKSICWGIIDDGNLIGFFAASANSSGIYKKIFMRNFLYFSIPLLSVFIKKPHLFIRMFRSFHSTTKHDIPHTCQSALLSICVLPKFMGMGIGRQLIEKLEIELASQKIFEYYLTTDACSNDLTNKFYKKNGFLFYSAFWQGNRKMNLYIKNIK